MSNSLDVASRRQRQPLRISTDVPRFGTHSSDFSSSSSSPTNQSLSPSWTTPSAGDPDHFFRVLCMHDFESEDPVQLSFRKDEVLTIIKQERSGWWAATSHKGDRIGWIPSSFVQPLDRSKVEYADEALWRYESSNDPPLSAIYDSWVPVSDGYKVPSLQLVTPTDLVLHRGFYDDRVRNHSYDSFFDLSDDEQSSSDTGDVCISPISESTIPRRAQNSPCPSSPLPSKPGTVQLTQPASRNTISEPRSSC